MREQNQTGGVWGHRERTHGYLYSSKYAEPHPQGEARREKNKHPQRGRHIKAFTQAPTPAAHAQDLLDRKPINIPLSE